MALRGIYATLADAHSHPGPDRAEGRSGVGEDSTRMESLDPTLAELEARVSRGDAIDDREARLIVETPDLIAVGVMADLVRRRLHGTRTTFVRVFEIDVARPPSVLPAGVSAGEVRIVGRPSSLE